MKMQRRITNYLFIGLIFVGMVYVPQVSAQTKEGAIFLTRKQIMEGARKEGKLSITPGHGRKVIPKLVKAFQKKYPFIKTRFNVVKGITASEKQLFEMQAGTANLDAFRLFSTYYGQYFKHNLFKRIDFKGMAKAGHLEIPLEMIDDSGLIVWLGSQFGVITYNSKLVPPEKAPKGWESCLDPQWKGKFSVDTKPSVFTWLKPAWGVEKVLDFASKLKKNQPIWSRGHTRNVTLLAAGEIYMNCGTYLHSAERILKKDPTAPITIFSFVSH